IFHRPCLISHLFHFPFSLFSLLLPRHEISISVFAPVYLSNSDRRERVSSTSRKRPIDSRSTTSSLQSTSVFDSRTGKLFTPFRTRRDPKRPRHLPVRFRRNRRSP